MILPPTIEPHVHTRGFNQEYKETIETATRAAIAGGVGTIIAMPNYDPLRARPYEWSKMHDLQQHAKRDNKLYCDAAFWATYLPGISEPRSLIHVAPLAAGIKYYVEPTQGNPEPVAVSSFELASRIWHYNAKRTQPIAAHVEDASIEEAIDLFARRIGHPFYVPHINNRFLLEKVIAAKKEGLPVYAATTIDHLAFTDETVSKKGWLARMKPPLASAADREFLLDHMEWIDVIETDHAPHTLEEKELANSANPEGSTEAGAVTCFGTPNLEAVLPFLVTLVKNGQLTQQQLREKTVSNPARIFGLALHRDSYVKIVDDDYEFSRDMVFSKCGWNSFEGYNMKARVAEVALRGTVVFKDGQFTDARPAGRLISK